MRKPARTPRARNQETELRSRTKEGLGREDSLTGSLALVDVLEPLSEGELEDLAARCLTIHLESGEAYPCSEESDGGLLLVKEGRVWVYRLTSKGRQFTLALLGDGSAFPIRGSHDLHIQAMEPSTITLMRQAVLEALIRERPEVALRITSLLSALLGRSEERVRDMIHKDVPSRLASAIMKLVETK